ncbi:hypothetical protein [Streptomyces prunicolor]|uniref:hypothetical protein n=1 Tax=Streptomyces prunicolor TaxID=67348 RepID=UPI00131A1589|nr:hypothetical protein [Streptomyces prunicolor]
MRIQFEPDWVEKLEPQIETYIGKLAEQVYNDMVVLCPKKTGRLMADLAWEVDGTSARIGAKTVDYAYYVEVGTRPHTIRPNGKGALWWAGARHPVNMVEHPGYEGSHFMRKSLYKAR